MGHPLFDLRGKSAVVVGGTSGIGLAMAIGLAEAGADVVASSRRPEQGDEGGKAVEGTGGRAVGRDPGGVGALTKPLAVEWSSQGVTVNAIAPGVFRTALNQKLLDESDRGKELLMRTPMGRFGKTVELVGSAIFLASEASAFVTGEILVVDGGFLASGVNQ